MKSLLACLRKIYNKILPEIVIKRLREFRRRYLFLKNIFKNFYYDFQRFIKWSAIKQEPYTKTQLRAKITQGYHKFEKGLTLKNPRPNFGCRVTKLLFSDIKEYIAHYGADETIDFTLNALFTYYLFNLDYGVENDELLHELMCIKPDIRMHHTDPNSRGGVEKVNRQDIQKHTQYNFQDFFLSRHSIRNFSSEEVDIKLIEQAVAMAQNTPSVCNRQAWHVYSISNPEQKSKVLSLQHGNRGFGEFASKILIVTTELGNFLSIGERNQYWIDGGMFAMSLVYALHALGLGSCCLNWCVNYEVDRQLRTITEIPDSEVVIMMIAVGSLPDEFLVTQSPRITLSEVLISDVQEDNQEMLATSSIANRFKSHDK